MYFKKHLRPVLSIPPELISVFQKFWSNKLLSPTLKMKLTINRVKTALKKDKTKIFCIGRNKTGTTSLHHAMKSLGYITGNQLYAETLHDQWLQDDLSDLLKYCHTAQFFQDVPFSLPNYFKIFDAHFPNSKFILTVRDSPEQWYESLTRFHSKLWGVNGQLPTVHDLQNTSYVTKGFAWEVNKKLYGDTESPYDRTTLLEAYSRHNEEVISHFASRPEQLLVLNVSDESAPYELTSFLNCPTKLEIFPWENKT